MLQSALIGIQGRSYRFDEDVRAELAKLRAVYGTDNAAMRFVFGLTGKVEVKRIERVEGQVPTVVLKRPAPGLDSQSAITKLDGKTMEYTRAGFRIERGPRPKGDKTR